MCNITFCFTKTARPRLGFICGIHVRNPYSEFTDRISHHTSLWVDERTDFTSERDQGSRTIIQTARSIIASKLWPEQRKNSDAIAKEASRILEIALQRRRTFFSGKSAGSILSGLFYWLGIVFNSARTQREIAISLNTSDVTVRESSREWMEYFNDLFRADFSTRARAAQDLLCVSEAGNGSGNFDALLLDVIDTTLRYCIGDKNANMIYSFLKRESCSKAGDTATASIFLRTAA